MAFDQLRKLLGIEETAPDAEPDTDADPAAEAVQTLNTEFSKVSAAAAAVLADKGEEDEDDERAAAEAAAAGAKAERRRWATVLTDKRAEGRTALAIAMLGTTESSADQILAILPTAGSGQQSGMAQRLATTPNPDTGTPDAAAEDADRQAREEIRERAVAKANAKFSRRKPKGAK